MTSSASAAALALFVLLIVPLHAQDAAGGIRVTAGDATRKTVALEECVSKWPGHPDHILIEKDVCEKPDYERLRAAGFAFASQEPNTEPLYRCYSDAEKSHFASNKEDCGQMGRREALLGYVLKD